MAKRKTPPQSWPVSVELNGKTYTGTYEVDAGIVTVRTLMGSKNTQVGGSTPQTLAPLMLSELVKEGRA